MSKFKERDTNSMIALRVPDMEYTAEYNLNTEALQACLTIS